MSYIINHQGVFVEAFELNVRDFTQRVIKSAAMDRSMIFNAAANQSCPEPFLNFERPMYEEMSLEKVGKGEKPVPHWLRRQIGRVTAKDSASNKQWKIEKVKCMTIPQLLHEANTGKKRK